MSAALATACLVCGAPNGSPLYRSDGPLSVTSTARPIELPTIVFACDACGHVQTPPLADIDRYYDSAYNVHLESDSADDLYEVRDGLPVYRAQHQADVALAKLALAHGASVLDYGCGKGMTLRAALAARPDLRGYVFDVSDAYRAAWDAFVPRDRQAAYEPPPHWAGGFDAVLSFFALEHVSDPRGFLRAVRALLRPGGQLHLTVPNVLRNAGDLIVVDHVNHFMPTSLRRAFADAGFTGIRIDEEAHAAAYVVTARRAEAPEPAESDPEFQPSYRERQPRHPELQPRHPDLVEGRDGVARYVAEARRLAAFWSAAGEAVAAFERDVARGRRSAIYGSGFYGVFIASRLADRSHVVAFLDRNPHQQTKRIFGLPVIAPEHIGDEIDVLYAGLNPATARSIIAGVPSLSRRPRDVFFLEKNERS